VEERERRVSTRRATECVDVSERERATERGGVCLIVRKPVLAQSCFTFCARVCVDMCVF